MSADTAAMPLQPIRLARRQGRRQARAFAAVVAIAIAAGAAAVFAATPEYRVVIAPAVASIAVTLIYLAVLTRRQGQLPVFEAATYFVLATCVYTVIPLVQFAMSGLQCTLYGDYRLFSWAPTPQEFGGFAWRHVLLLTTFVAVYLPVRGKRLWKAHQFDRPSSLTVGIIVTLVVLLNAFFLSLSIYIGPVKSVYEGGTGAEYLALPYVVRQLANVTGVMRVTLKQSLIVLLLARWRQMKWRLVLLGWLLLEMAVTVAALESRVTAVVLLVTFAAAYHHIVKPFRVTTAFAAGAFVLGGFLLFGVFRDLGTYKLSTHGTSAWGYATEFQVLYGNAYDIRMRKLTGGLPPVPHQIYLSDLYRLIPSQLLPFEKIDPALWYRDLLGYGDTGMGFVFGIVAQTSIGFDWIELAVRAVLLALFYAFVHRAWRRYSRSFWATVAYVFILAWAYYAFRASSFEILYRLVYYLAPAVVAVKVLTILLSRSTRRRGAPASA